MAMSPLITWEFNASATGNMVNGGGFKAGASGTDYSLATTAHLTITDLVIGADNTTVTSALTPFDAQDVGNVLHITAGTNFTVGWYEVISVASAIATLDRACGTATSTGGTAYLGGALSLNSTLDSDFFAQLVAGQKVYFLKGNYTLGEAISGATTGTNVLPIFVTGYTGTRDTACNGFDRPNIACGTNAVTTGSYWWIRNLSFTTLATNGIFTGGYTILENCKSINSRTSVNGAAFYLGDIGVAINTEGISYNGYGIITSNYVTLIGCYGHHSSTGIVTGVWGNVINCISANNTTNAILTNTGIRLINNILYGSEGKLGTGINMGAKYAHLILNNIIYGFTTGISATAADTQTYLDYNDFYNNTADVSNVTKLGNNIATDPLFTNPAGTLIEDCEDAWNEYTGTGVTATADTDTYKIGTASARATCLASTGVEVVMTEAITPTNMSAYNGIGCWVRSTVALAAGDWQLLLDDHANCVSPIKTLNLPAMAANTWYWVYLDGDDMSLASAIISIGLKQAVDKGAMSFYIDDVRAANNDFTASSSSGGAIGKGFPQSMPGAIGDYQMNIGVDQDDNTVSVGSDIFGWVG